MSRIFDVRLDKAMADLVNASGSANFPEALSYFVARQVHFDNLIIIVYHKDHTPQELYRESEDPLVYEKMQTHYLSGAYMLDPFYHVVRSGIQTGIHSIFDLAPDQFKFTSYFNEYYDKTTLIDEFALFAPLGLETTLTACFGRDESRGTKFSKTELKHIRSFEKVLSALCTQHWKDYQPKEGKNISLPPVTERLRDAVFTQHDISLSPRQAEVALHILQGHSSLSISLNLNISKETVKVFRKQLYAKCQISSQAELFALLMPVISSI
ncbi:response regulator FixJ [Vibrio aerogenes CECT 7868]|uniref:Response regulator FixJ n=1 Tax=Vibrio aerogenes CECT 7868 TaxID=1216006 RepID=A0A1M6AH60_9VIBR|nr:helix-turn-helix transcriptional regulator [Vibrio aerogenes]SHI35860.1 response regulator FixJ [Vibrio aerogenes CECT 7868]